MNSENNIAIPEINTVDVDHYVNLSTIQQEDLKNPVESNQETLEEQINREQWVKLSLDEVHAKMKELKIPPVCAWKEQGQYSQEQEKYSESLSKMGSFCQSG